MRKSYCGQHFLVKDMNMKTCLNVCTIGLVVLFSQSSGNLFAAGRKRAQKKQKMRPPVLEKGSYEEEVWNQVYDPLLKKRYRGYYWSKLTLPELKKYVSYDKYDIDPAEFSRDLDSKKKALQVLRDDLRQRTIKGLRGKTNIVKYMQDLNRGADYYGRLDYHVDELHALALAIAQIPEYRDNEDLRMRFYQTVIKLCEAEPSPGTTWTSENFKRPKAAYPILLLLQDRMEKDKKAGAFRKVIPALQENLKRIILQAWRGPKENFRWSNYLTPNTFRFNSAWQHANVIFRPLMESAAVFEDTRMVDVVKRVIELGFSSRASFFNAYENYWQFEGLTVDGAAMAHWQQNFLFDYDSAFVNYASILIARLKGTPWEIDNSIWENRADYLLDGVQWFVYRGATELSIRGGGTSKHPKKEKHRLLDGRNKLLSHARHTASISNGPYPRSKEVAAMVQRIENGEDLVGNHYFWVVEDFVHRRKGFYFCANLSSFRSKGPEGHHGAGKKNFHYGDGVTMILHSGLEYFHARGAWQYDDLPGLTAEKGNVPPGDGLGFYGNNIFAGGLSDGSHGCAGFKLDKDQVNLRAMKGYFAFDNDVVCLGRVTALETKHDTYTTIDQPEIASEILYSINGKESKIDKGANLEITETLSSPAWIWHNNTGYVILPQKKSELCLQATKRKTDWESLSKGGGTFGDYPVSLLRLAINHGGSKKFNPDDSRSAYQYVVLGNVNADEVKQYAEHMPLRILENSKSIQAVAHDKMRITQAIFYRPGTLNTGSFRLTANIPVIVMVNESRQGKVAITISDPLHNPNAKEMSLLTDLPVRGKGVVRRGSKYKITIPLPVKPYVGKSTAVELVRL